MLKKLQRFIRWYFEKYTLNVRCILIFYFRMNYYFHINDLVNVYRLNILRLRNLALPKCRENQPQFNWCILKNIRRIKAKILPYLSIIYSNYVCQFISSMEFHILSPVTRISLFCLPVAL